VCDEAQSLADHLLVLRLQVLEEVVLAAEDDQRNRKRLVRTPVRMVGLHPGLRHALEPLSELVFYSLRTLQS